MNKTCTKCKIEKDISCFKFRKDRGHYESACISCSKNISKEYRNKNKEKIKQRQHLYYLKNKDYLIKKNSENYFNKNKDSILKASYLNKNNLKECSLCKETKSTDMFYLKKNKKTLKNIISSRCKTCHLIITNKWRTNNIDKVREKNRINYRQNIDSKRKNFRNDVNNVRTLNYLRKRLAEALKANKATKKVLKTLDYVGCTKEELIKHLFSTLPKNSTIKDYINGKLHIDHIIPFKFYIDRDGNLNESNIHEVMNYKNLQFLWAKDNLKKAGKY